MNIHGVCHDVSQMLMVTEDGVVALNRVHFWLAALKHAIFLPFLGERKRKKFCRLGVLCEHVFLNCFANSVPKRKLTFTI